MNNKNTNISNACNIVNMYEPNVVGLYTYMYVSQLYLYFYAEKKNHHITENLLSYIRFFFISISKVFYGCFVCQRSFVYFGKAGSMCWK